MLQLRDYQEVLIAKTREALRSHRRVIMQAPTGAGKTAITLFMMQAAAEGGKSAMFIVHQKELINQTSKAFWKQKLEHGLILSGKSHSKMPLKLASVQTLVNRLDKTDAPDLIVIDEAHRAAAGTYQKVIDAYPRAYVIGLTATPQRTDGKGLDCLFSGIVQGPSIDWLINQGYLCNYRVFAPAIGISTEGIKSSMGDFDRHELEAASDRPSIIANAVAEYKKAAYGKRCVVMCVTIKHAKHVAEQYNAAGIPAACIEGGMTDAEREAVLTKLERGELLVVTNVQLLIEGVDIPRIEVVQWLRPTQSLIVWMQGNGRGLRPAPGKEALLILDHASNSSRHGLPCEPREWTLDGKAKSKRKTKDDEGADVNIQQCKSCYAVFRPGPDSCPMCGAPIERKERKLNEVDGELAEVDVQAARLANKRDQGQARTLDDLVALGVRRGMAKPSQWAAIMQASREGRKPTPADFNKAREILKGLRA
jgi:DNA repair protein RadD